MLRRSARGPVPTLDALRSSVESELNLLARLLTKVNLVGDLQDTPRDLLELARDLKSLEKRLIPLLEDFALRLTVAGMSDESARYTAMIYSSQKAMGEAKRDLNVILHSMRMKTVSQIDSVSSGSGSVSLIDPNTEYMKSPFQGDSMRQIC